MSLTTGTLDALPCSMALLDVRALCAVLACGLSAACATGAAMRSETPRDDRGHKSYIIPVVEIAALDAAVNLGGRLVAEPAAYHVTPDSVRRNLRSAWVVDDDPFEINQFGHPYQGAMYHGIARSNGLSYWPSAATTFAASALWEIAGETTPPSLNDQIASGIAGSFLGESLFRISRLLLERSDHGPGVWRTLGAVLASPPTGLNHLMLGDPAGSVAADAVPFSDIRVQFGATAIATGRSRPAPSLSSSQPELALSMDYGYPGNAGYRHTRPFDYFRIDSSVSSEGLEQLSTRGLLAGFDYTTQRLGGIAGLYGSYDYFAPDDFHFSSTALLFGTTLQASISESLVVQSTGLLGGGYVATHSAHPTDERGYHYGLAPQALANVRLITGRRVALDVTAREYFVSTVGGFGTRQRDLISVGDASLAIRLYRKHALGLTCQLARRRSDNIALPDQTLTRSRVGIFYTFLGSGGFGAVR